MRRMEAVQLEVLEFCALVVGDGFGCGFAEAFVNLVHDIGEDLLVRRFCWSGRAIFRRFVGFGILFRLRQWLLRVSRALAVDRAVCSYHMVHVPLGYARIRGIRRLEGAEPLGPAPRSVGAVVLTCR